MKTDQRVNARFTKKQFGKIRLLAYKWKCSMAEVLRRLVETAEREKLNKGDE